VTAPQRTIRPGWDLLAHGGVRFARSLVETSLIDEYRLMIHPVVLGAGERLFLAPPMMKVTAGTMSRMSSGQSGTFATRAADLADDREREEVGDAE
jgi:dihydrofolate reductase